MSVTLADLIDEIRSTANVQHTLFLDDEVEMPRIVNLAVSNCYNTVVKAYAPYFAKHANFTLDATGEIDLDAIVNPVQAALPVNNSITVFGSDVSSPPIVTSLPNPATYIINQFVIDLTGTTDTGTTTFTIFVNGVSTGCVISIPNGSVGEWSNTSVNPEFRPGDSVTVVIAAGHSGSGYGVNFSFLITPVLHNPRFFKELGVDYLGNGMRLTVPRLSSYMHRNDGYIQTYPFAGAYTLHYIESAPVLDEVTDLPFEMERFRQMILLEGAIRVAQKRKDTEQVGSFRAELNIVKRETEESLRSRINEPKVIPTRAQYGSCGRSFDIIGPTMKLFATLGNGGNTWGGYRFSF